MAGNLFTKHAVPFEVAGETFKTVYRVAGDLSVGCPLICLHGGPGFPCDVLEPFGNLSRFGIPVIIYDQFGCGDSLPEGEDRNRLYRLNPDGALWSVELFVNELHDLITHLGISERFSLLGHSWGGMLAMEYTVRRQPVGLQSLVLADTLAKTSDWIESTLRLLDSKEFGFPRDLRNIIKYAEKHHDLNEALTVEEIKALDEEAVKVDMDSQKYKGAVKVFLETFDCRLSPWPECFQRTVEKAAKSPVSGYMWGKGWGNPSGVLADWNIEPDLHKIHVRTLVYNGAYEQAQDSVIAPIFRGITKCKWIKFENSSHLPHLEEPERCLKAVRDFLLDFY